MDGQTDGRTESILSKTALCIASYADALSKSEVRDEMALLLVRERSALADPYCQSTWMYVRLYVCVSRPWTPNISESKAARG